MRKRQKVGLTIWFLNIFIIICLKAAWAEELLPAPGKPLTLEQCTALALKYHPSLRANQATIEASRAKVEQALAAYYPQINLATTYTSGTANYYGSGPYRTGTHNWTFYDSYSLGPSLSQNIYDFGRTRNTVTISRENVKANEEELAITKQTVILNVKQAYFDVLQKLRLIKVAEETVKQNREKLDQALGFFQAGTRPKIDVTKAEVDLANAELNLIRAKNNFQVARVALNNAMGLSQELTFAIEDSLDFQAYEITLEEILRKSFAQRPEVLQIKARQRSQEAAIRLAQASYYPTISGNASYLYRGGELNDLYWDFTIGATLSIPLFSGFSSPNQVAEARANLKNLKAQEENLKLSIRLEAEQAYLSLKEAEERIRVTEKAVVQAQENYELARGRYQVGVGSPLEITDAEVLLANARANHIQALYDYKVAAARIEKAMGMMR
ncbi:MAG: TolC family protein [Thermodesulfobacteriota bacterium]